MELQKISDFNSATSRVSILVWNTFMNMLDTDLIK